LFLRGFDQDVRPFVAEEMRKKGIDLRFESTVEQIVKQDDGSLKVTLVNGDELEADVVLYATGRVPHTLNIGLETVSVECDKAGYIQVDENFQTTEPGIYALGDVIGGQELTPVALAEGMALAKALFNSEPCKVDYESIPTAVFCQPNIGTVGLTEAEAREKYEDIEVYRSNFRAMKHTIGGRDERTLMKLLVDKASQRVVGVHMVGADAGEILQGIAIAIKAGATKAIFDSTIGIHPTAAEEFVTMREPVRYN
jgi:glutathione reductase (NADPH)